MKTPISAVVVTAYDKKAFQFEGLHNLYYYDYYDYDYDLFWFMILIMIMIIIMDSSVVLLNAKIPKKYTRRART